MNAEDYVSLEVAKMLREKGFGEICHAYWWQYKNETRLEIENYRFSKIYLEARNNGYDDVLLAPTLYEVAKWLREKHKMVVCAFLSEPFVEPLRFMYFIQSPNFGLDDYSTIIKNEDFSSYEEALNAGILEALKLI